ncbi:MAG TPA: acyltransferase [Parvibaculum sp.]
MTSYISDEQLKGSRNRFDLLRLFAAYLVIVTHSGVLFKNLPGDFYLSLTGGTTGGQLAVSIFFIISGFLIYGSAVNSKSLGLFLFSRATRLYPAAFCCAVITAFGIGLYFTRLNAWDYLSQWSPYRFVETNTFLFGVQYMLPGVFIDNVGSSAVNGSLWTIPLEIKMYLFCAGGVFVLRRPALFIAAAIALYAIAVAKNPHFHVGADGGDFRKYSFAYYFFAGSALYVLRHRIPISGLVFVPFAVAYAVSFNTPAFDFIEKLFLPYAVLYLAFSFPDFQLGRFAPPDISYGVYIYGFPLQQSVSTLLGRTHSLLFCFVVATLAITLFAVLSWYLIEGRALAGKRAAYARLVVFATRISAPAKKSWSDLRQNMRRRSLKNER